MAKRSELPARSRTDPAVLTEYHRTGGATTLKNIVGGANAVNSFVMRLPIPWNVVVQHDVGEQVLTDVNVTLHGAQESTCCGFRWPPCQ